jgi:hypothetical protein
MHAAGGDDVEVVVAQLLRRGRVRLMTLAGGTDGVGSTEEALTGDGGDIDAAAAAARDHLTRHPCRQEDTPFEFTRWMRSQSALSLHAHFAIASGAETDLRPKRHCGRFASGW